MPEPEPDCYHGHYVTLFALLCQDLTYNLTKCSNVLPNSAACRLPKFAVESFEPKIGKKFLILVAASSAVAPRSAEIKYYVPSFCTFFPLPGPNCSRQFGRTPAM